MQLIKKNQNPHFSKIKFLSDTIVNARRIDSLSSLFIITSSKEKIGSIAIYCGDSDFSLLIAKMGILKCR